MQWRVPPGLQLLEGVGLLQDLCCIIQTVADV